MMSLKFAFTLLDNKIITSDQFIELVRVHEDSKLPPVAIALSQSMVTIQQVKAIMKRQEQKPDRSFGRVATELGIWNSIDCERMAHVQDKTRRSIRSIVVEKGICSEGQVQAIERILKADSAHSSPRRNLPSPKFSRRTRHPRKTSEIHATVD